MNLRSEIDRFRLVSLVEGISYIVLLAVAMPLKYAAGIPQAVRVVGMAHGVLFVAFCVALFAVASDRDWPWRKSATAMIAALLPFGAFWLERRLRSEAPAS